MVYRGGERREREREFGEKNVSVFEGSETEESGSRLDGLERRKREEVG